MADEPETYYEMLWDCTQCGTTGLLGTTHRHCPACGAAQDPAKRYFPEPGQEVEARNHRYVGVDWACLYCATSNSNAAAFCVNCGAGKDGTQPVALKTDAEAPAPSPAPPPAAKPRAGRRLLWVLGAVLLALVMGALYLFTATRDATATVAARDWSREIQVERLVRVPESGWREAVPPDAYRVMCQREQRSTRQVPDGQVCQDVRLDKGDGSFVKHRECSTRYRSEPVYGERCSYQVNRWRSTRAVQAGSAQAALPFWPGVGALATPPVGSNLASGVGAGGATGLGTERLGPRSERYVLHLNVGGKTQACDVPEAVWAKYQQGATVPLKTRLAGGVDCAAIQ